MKTIQIALITVLLLLTGCSVYMAANKKGAEYEDLSACKTRSCLMAHGAEPLDVPELPPNTEAFKVLKAQGSTGRAVMHGLLDVATLGLWEIAGTPMEGRYNRDKYYALRVTFEPDSENIKEIALAQ